MITLCAVSIGILTMSRFKAFGKLEYRPCRAVAFMSLGLLTVFPTFHAYFKVKILFLSHKLLNLICSTGQESLSMTKLLLFFASSSLLEPLASLFTRLKFQNASSQENLTFSSTVTRLKKLHFRVIIFQIFHIFAVGAGAVHFLAIRELQAFHAEPCPTDGWTLDTLNSTVTVDSTVTPL